MTSRIKALILFDVFLFLFALAYIVLPAIGVVLDYQEEKAEAAQPKHSCCTSYSQTVEVNSNYIVISGNGPQNVEVTNDGHTVEINSGNVTTQNVVVETTEVVETEPVEKPVYHKAVKAQPQPAHPLDMSGYQFQSGFASDTSDSKEN